MMFKISKIDVEHSKAPYHNKTINYPVLSAQYIAAKKEKPSGIRIHNPQLAVTLLPEEPANPI